MIEDQIKQFISENFYSVMERFGKRGCTDAYRVLMAFTEKPSMCEDLAEIVMDGYPNWEAITLTEGALDGNVRWLAKDEDGHAFRSIVYKFLAIYALRTIVNGEDYIQSLMPKVVEFNDELEIDNASRGRDLRGAA